MGEMAVVALGLALPPQAVEAEAQNNLQVKLVAQVAAAVMDTQVRVRVYLAKGTMAVTAQTRLAVEVAVRQVPRQAHMETVAALTLGLTV